MLHIATVHFKSFRWIPIQARELRRNISGPYTTWGSVEGIDSAYRKYFDHVRDQRGTHPDKLNRLAAEISRSAADDDLIMFLDGDAFPVFDVSPLIESGLATAPLLAVRRVENGNEPYPHPCFCVTRVSTWRRLKGDWGSGAVATMGGASMKGPGGRLLEQLELSSTPWTQILRSNARNLHPVFFGVYGRAIYHHGAGFRRPISRADLAQLAPADRSANAPRAKLALRNLHLSLELFRRIEGNDPSWLAELTRV
jgi:hypothetical protein